MYLIFALLTVLSVIFDMHMTLDPYMIPEITLKRSVTYDVVTATIIFVVMTQV